MDYSKYITLFTHIKDNDNQYEENMEKDALLLFSLLFEKDNTIAKLCSNQLEDLLYLTDSLNHKIYDFNNELNIILDDIIEYLKILNDLESN